MYVDFHGSGHGDPILAKIDVENFEFPGTGHRDHFLGRGHHRVEELLGFEFEGLEGHLTLPAVQKCLVAVSDGQELAAVETTKTLNLLVVGLELKSQ